MVAVSSQTKCPKNSVWAQSGFDCLTCNNERCVRCAFIEKPGCYCNPDSVYLNSQKQECVRREDCPGEYFFMENINKILLILIFYYLVCIPSSSNNCGCAANSLNITK